jgi:hypothetical protein
MHPLILHFFLVWDEEGRARISCMLIWYLLKAVAAAMHYARNGGAYLLFVRAHPRWSKD